MADRKKNTRSTVAETTYILDITDGTQRKITVPTSWKITFGPVYVPKERLGGSSMPVALRFYEGNKENQRAIFTDVRAFRDAAIKIQEKRVQVKRQAATRQTQHGAKEFVAEFKVEEWVDPDKEEAATDRAAFDAIPDFTIKEK